MDIQHTRHTLAHLLARAVLAKYPKAKLTLGPAIDNGFYYDIDFGTEQISEEDLPALEKEMKKLLPTWDACTSKKVTQEEAKAAFAGNEYKLELIDEIAGRGEDITLYTFGDFTPHQNSDDNDAPISLINGAGFTDLCRGGHREKASDIPKDSFKLSHTAGAYWRGDEKNKMLTRIYGLAFESKQELEQYEQILEEAKKRDHKKLGVQLDLFTFSDLVGAGLPLWTPKGTIVRDLLDGFVWDLRKAAGYERVDIPHITKKELYEKSGHWEKFKDELMRITTREGHEFAMKPMNCPHHTQIYARRPHSYRDLPQRFASTTKVYRDEQTGELAGLSRVRSITQDDAHVFCRPDQVKAEIEAVWKIVYSFYGAFGFDLRVRLSTHDSKQMDKYLGSEETWDKAVATLREVATQNSSEPELGLGEAAFYGPKLDFMAKDAIGREHQVATIQLDFNQPERFELEYTAEDGSKQRVVMIHAAIMGSIERFMSVLIEHTAGIFPLWLAPVQVAILPISEKHVEYANKVANDLRLTVPDLRCEIYDANESIGKKIRQATAEKIPYLLVVGDKEMEGDLVAVRKQDGTDLGPQETSEFAKQLDKEIDSKA